MLDLKRVIASAPKKPTSEKLQKLDTPWTNTAMESIPLSEHPHPQFEREHFKVLNGQWDYCVVENKQAKTSWEQASAPNTWDGKILVPFSPEAPLSGVNRQLKPDELLWYRKQFNNPFEDIDESSAHTSMMPKNPRCILHFEAVDYACACYCNGVLLGTHKGAYLPFSFDITESLLSGENTLTLCVYDPSDEGVQLRGKQKLARGGIWYTAQSGIWQSVWIEVVPEERIESLHIDTQTDTGNLHIAVEVFRAKAAKAEAATQSICVNVLDGSNVVASGSSMIPEEVVQKNAENENNKLLEQRLIKHSFELVIPQPRLWSPDNPHLYKVEISYAGDKVLSYCAFRTISVEKDSSGTYRFFLNNEPLFLKGVLDQGYWPDGLMTAPSDEALIFDISSMKELGFNMLRKHIKVESDRWYYHCDSLGMLVWQDMICGGSPPKPWYNSYKPTFFRSSWGNYSDGPNHYESLSSENEDFRAEWTETCKELVVYLRNHPSIVTWVLFNEAWGQFEAAKATDMVRNIDDTRPIDAVSGWYDQACGNYLSVHNYFRPLEVYPDKKGKQRAFVISEFGGLSYHIPKHSPLLSSYGYESYSNLKDFQDAVSSMLKQACALEEKGLAGFVYTQLSDVEEETNGLLSYDRCFNKLAQKETL